MNIYIYIYIFSRVIARAFPIRVLKCFIRVEIFFFFSKRKKTNEIIQLDDNIFIYMRSIGNKILIKFWYANN